MLHEPRLGLEEAGTFGYEPWARPRKAQAPVDTSLGLDPRRRSNAYRGPLGVHLNRPRACVTAQERQLGGSVAVGRYPKGMFWFRLEERIVRQFIVKQIWRGM